MKLKATRYLTDKNASLAQFIEHDLHRLDYANAMRFYELAVPLMDHYGRALLGANDRYFLFTTLLRRPDGFHPWIYERCREVEAAPDGYLDLWSRYHFKSSLITFAGAIQEIINDPEINICILSNVKPLARSFLNQIKQELQDNPILKTLYGDVFFQKPRRESPHWSVSGLVVRRASNPKEATIEAHGLVDGQPVGMHYDLLIYDDIVTRRQAMNPSMVRLTMVQWENSDNLGKSGGTRKWMAGTRWSFGDPYGQLLDDKRVVARIYPATRDGTLTGEPVLLSKKRWAEVKRAQKSTVSAQMLLNPVAGNEAVFKSVWFRPYFIFPSIMNVYVIVDSSAGKKRFQGDQKSDRSAIVVIGIDPQGNKYLLDGYRHRMPLSERYQCIQQLRHKWMSHPGVQMVKVGYERYGKDADTEVIEDMANIDNDHFELIELNYPREGGGSKLARIERMEPDFSQDRFFLPGVVYKPIDAESARTIAALPGDRKSDGTSLWSVWREKDAAEWIAAEAKEMVRLGKNPAKNPPKSPHDIGAVIYRTFGALTRQQKFYDDAQQRFRIVKPIRRVDEDRDVYDLTLCAMEELRLHPFAPHDDLIDAMSRLYDMEPLAPDRVDVTTEDNEAAEIAEAAAMEYQ